MKTVGEFKKAGLQFVKDDCGDNFLVKNPVSFNDYGASFENDLVKFFAWRKNTGVKPDFSGAIEVLIGNNANEEHFICESASEVPWDLNKISRVLEWRPSLNQPSLSVESDTKQSAIHKAWVDLKGDLSNANKYDSKPHYLIFCIKDTVISKSGKYLLTEYVTNNDEYWRNVCTIQELTDYCEKMAAEEKRMDIIGQNGNDGLHYDNTAQQVEALAANHTLLQPRNPEPIFRTNEDTQKSLNEHLAKLAESKPIFTQAMADNGELPPVGSLFIDIEYNENKQVLALAHHLGKVVYAADYDDVSQVDYFHADQDECKPIDMRTERDKAIDAAMNEWPAADKSTLEMAYDFWRVGEKC